MIHVRDHPLLERPDVREWRERLAAANYFISLEDSLKLTKWWNLREGPLLLQGEPGSGKTELAKKVAEVMNAPLEVMPCYDGLGSDVALYSFDTTLQNILKEEGQRRGLTIAEIDLSIYSRACLRPGVMMRALLNPNPDTCVLADEIDKVQQGKYFEALFLEVLGSMQITIIETGEVVKPVSGYAPHILITSNATEDAPLSSPLLRRGPFIKFAGPSLERMYEVFQAHAPRMSERLRWSCVLFIVNARRTEMEKPISLSEAVMWVKGLQWLGVEELTPEVVLLTMEDLAKGEKEALRLAGVIRPILDHISTDHRLRGEAAA